LQKYGYDIKALSDANQTAAYREVGLNKAAGGGGDDKVINNLLMRAKGVDDSLNAYKKANESLIKRANLPGDTPEIKKMRADAQAKLDADPQYKSLMDRKAQVDGLLAQYQKVVDANKGGENTSAGNDPLNIRKP
jgi:molecular chaperone DnaK (HSP70)